MSVQLPDIFRQPVTVRRKGEPAPGDFWAEPGWSEPETLMGRKRVRQRRRLSSEGTEILTATEISLREELQIGDEIDGEAIQDRENRVWHDGSVMYWKFFQ